jgi:hypothetical protein
MAVVALHRIDAGYYAGSLRGLRYGRTGWPLVGIRREDRNGWGAYINVPTNDPDLSKPAFTTDHLGYFARLKDARNALIVRAALYY